jgi:DNA polymerase-1
VRRATPATTPTLLRGIRAQVANDSTQRVRDLVQYVLAEKPAVRHLDRAMRALRATPVPAWFGVVNGARCYARMRAVGTPGGVFSCMRRENERNAAAWLRAQVPDLAWTDVEFDFEAESCRFAGLNDDALKKHLRECGFTSLLKRMGEDDAGVKPQAPRRAKYQPFEQGLFGPMGGDGSESATAQAQGDGPQPQTCADCSYECADTDEKFEIYIDLLRQQKRFAFDTETDSLNPISTNLVGISISWKPGTGYYLPVRCPEGSQALECDAVLKALRPFLEDESVKKVGHNIKFDQLVLRAAVF